MADTPTEQSGGGTPPLLELVNVSKHFGGVLALQGVSFELRAGEIHGLVGENGAGKSTMMKIIAGVHTDFEGIMKIKGRDVRLRSAGDALSNSIGMVHQELSAIPDLTVAENVFLGHQPVNAVGKIDWARMNREARTLLHGLGLDINPKRTMGSLPVGLQQLVELSRVLFSGAQIIILDEPTSALSPPEVARLFDVLRRLRDEGRSIVFISHFLDDVLAISDRITVFRNGKKVITEETSQLDKNAVIAHMIGRGSKDMHMGEEAILSGDDAKPVILAVENVGDGKYLHDFSINLRAGEITGVYGFMGSGQIELARALFGKLKLRRGTLKIDGKQVKFHSTAAARKAGIAFVGENRRMMLFRGEPVYKNVSISHSRAHSPPVAEAEEPSVQSPRPISRTCRSVRHGPGSPLVRCRAAISKRWRWPNG